MGSIVSIACEYCVPFQGSSVLGYPHQYLHVMPSSSFFNVGLAHSRALLPLDTLHKETIRRKPVSQKRAQDYKREANRKSSQIREAKETNKGNQGKPREIKQQGNQ